MMIGHHHSKYHKSDKHDRTAKKLTVAAIFLAVAATAVLCGIRFWENRAFSVDTDTSDPFHYDYDITYIDGRAYRKKPGLETLLLIGVDKFDSDRNDGGYLNNEQADFLMLLVIDNESKTYSALHLNRDTITNIRILGVGGEEAGREEMQLALAHTYGSGGSDSCLNTTDAVSTLLYSTEINHYISVTMDAVEILNDSVGGVTLEIKDDLTKDDPMLIYGREVKLTGKQALLYVRARQSVDDSTNLHRMERQRQYLTALKDRLEILRAEGKWSVYNIFPEITKYMVSDCTVNQFEDYLDKLSEYEFTGINAFDGRFDSSTGIGKFYVKDEDVRDWVKNTIFVEADITD